MLVPMNGLVTDGPSLREAFRGPRCPARPEGGFTMAAQDCEATRLVIRGASRSRLEPGRVGRRGAESSWPAGAWDRIGPAPTHPRPRHLLLTPRRCATGGTCGTARPCIESRPERTA